jgi:glycosyltransferase involved in cell wall biosynthesis
VTSGVLVEAVAAGKPVVATAFPHAVELLNGSRGTVVEHESPTAIADAVRGIVARSGGPRAARQDDAGTSWLSVVQRYRELAETMTSTIARTA